jgi:hypothetical protein
MRPNWVTGLTFSSASGPGLRLPSTTQLLEGASSKSGVRLQVNQDQKNTSHSNRYGALNPSPTRIPECSKEKQKAAQAHSTPQGAELRRQCRCQSKYQRMLWSLRQATAIQYFQIDHRSVSQFLDNSTATSYIFITGKGSAFGFGHH